MTMNIRETMQMAKVEAERDAARLQISGLTSFLLDVKITLEGDDPEEALRMVTEMTGG